MNVLLVASPRNYFGIDILFRFPNLGLCSIAGNISKDLATIYIADLLVSGKDPDRYFAKLVKDLKPDIIGFSSMAFQYEHLLYLAKMAKSINPKVTTVFGGYYPTIDYDTIAENGDMKYIDFTLSGEGEISFNDFIKAYKSDKDFSNIPGITYIENGNIIHRPHDCPVNLDELKFPDRDARILKKGFHSMGLKADSIETSRGCVYDCNFCSIRMMYGKSFRKYKIERVLADITDAKKRGAKAIMMTDDNITIDGNRFKELCYGIKSSGLNDIRYLLQASIRGIKNTNGLVKAMADAGMKWIFLGIENVSEANLAQMNKGKQFDTSDTIEVIKELKAHKMFVIGGFILGNPDDTEESFWDNYNFAKQMKIDLPVFNTITPYPKTGIRKELLEKGLITNLHDYTKYDCYEVNIKTNHLSSEKIKTVRNEMDMRYHIESGTTLNLFSQYPLFFTKLMGKLLCVKPWDRVKGVYKAIKGNLSRNNSR